MGGNSTNENATYFRRLQRRPCWCLRRPSASADNLTLYCAADEAWCQQVARGFEEETGITVDMTRKSSGEIYAQVRAEAATRKATSGGPAPAIRTSRPPKKT